VQRKLTTTFTPWSTSSFTTIGCVGSLVTFLIPSILHNNLKNTTKTSTYDPAVHVEDSLGKNLRKRQGFAFEWGRTKRRVGLSRDQILRAALSVNKDFMIDLNLNFDESNLYIE
jgi:hypothetical protein